MYNLGLVYLKLEKYHTSLKYLEKAESNGLVCPEIYNALGLCYSKLDNLDLAEQHYNKSLELFPHNPETLCNLAAIKGRKFLYEEALKLYGELIKLNRYDGTALNNSAWCFEHLGKLDEAIGFYYRALALDTNNITFRLNLSQCLFKKGDFCEAIEHLEKILEIDKENYQALTLLGNIYDKNKLHAKAVDYYNRALGLE